MFITDLYTDDDTPAGDKPVVVTPEPIRNPDAYAAAEAEKQQRLSKKYADMEKELNDIKSAKAKEEEERALKNGEVQKLYDATKGELEAMKAVAVEADGLRVKLKEIEDARRAELIERIPVKYRDDYKGDEVSLGELERAAKLLGAVKPANGSSPAGTPPTDTGEKKPGDKFTQEELIELSKSDPAKYAEVLKAQFKPTGQTGPVILG